MAVTVSEASPGGSIKIGIKINAPDTELGRAVLGNEHRAAILVAFAGLNGFDRLDAGVAELHEQRLDDVVLHAQAATVRDERAKFAADEFPVLIKHARFRAGGFRQERQAV